MRENEFQKNLIKEIKSRFPGAFILKNDSGYMQGVPDLTILYKDHWAVLECKAGEHARRQPNQEYYIDILNEMSFAAVIYPENKEDILDGMESAFQS